MALPPDVRRVRQALAPLGTAARDQRWDDARPWRARTHVWDEGGVVVVDLHDLKVALAKRAVDGVLRVADELEGGAVVFVTGRGRHSAGKAVLPEVVAGKLHAAAQDRPGWEARPGAAGRQLLVLDPARAPAHVGTGLAWGARLVLVALALAAAWLCAGKPGL